MAATSNPATYADMDGLPMADSTVQFEWIVYIKKGLDWLFSDDPQVFVGGNLLWYPIEGDPKRRQAPDVMVVFGRPKRNRGSYQQWLEADIPPQVVFEVVSYGNTIPEMTCKFQFYDRHGVEEYYIYDPDRASLGGFIRQDGEFEAIDSMDGWVSPYLGVGFGLQDGRLELVRPNGQPFETYEQLAARAEEERERADQESLHNEAAQEQILQLEEQLNQQRAEVQRLRSHLKLLGVDPDQPPAPESTSELPASEPSHE